jgi:hypothetical protein
MNEETNSFLKAVLYWYAKERPDLDFTLALKKASGDAVSDVDQNLFQTPSDKASESKPNSD